VSRGGLISLIAPSTADVTGSALMDNRAALSGLQSFGAAVYAGGGASRLRLASSSVMRSVASGIGMAAGGGFHVATLFLESDFVLESTFHRSDQPETAPRR
jgi:aspartate oxidase